jgi:hypothetical protein
MSRPPSPLNRGRASGRRPAKKPIREARRSPTRRRGGILTAISCRDCERGRRLRVRRPLPCDVRSAGRSQLLGQRDSRRDAWGVVSGRRMVTTTSRIPLQSHLTAVAGLTMIKGLKNRGRNTGGGGACGSQQGRCRRHQPMSWGGSHAATNMERGEGSEIAWNRSTIR